MIVRLVDSARGRLGELYASGLPKAVMAARKQQIFAQLRASYAVLRPQLGTDTGYDRFFNGPLNNASLLTVTTYTHWVPAFRALLAENGGELPAFYRVVKRLMRLPPGQRDAELQKLMVKSAAASGG